MMIIGPILNVLGIMMISLSTEYYQLFLAHACNGIGGGLLYVPVLTTVAQGHGEKYRPLAMGLVAAGNGLGGILYTIVFLKLQPSSLGFAWTVRVMGFMALLCFLVAVPTLLAGEHPKRGGRARALVDKAAFTDAKFMVFAWGQMLGFWGYIPFIFYLTIYAQVKLGASSTTAYYLLVGAQGGSTLGRVMAGLLARYLGTMIPWIACLVASGILALAWIGAQNIGGFAAVVVLFGLCSPWLATGTAELTRAIRLFLGLADRPPAVHIPCRVSPQGSARHPARHVLGRHVYCESDGRPDRRRADRLEQGGFLGIADLVWRRLAGGYCASRAAVVYAVQAAPSHPHLRGGLCGQKGLRFRGRNVKTFVKLVHR